MARSKSHNIHNQGYQLTCESLILSSAFRFFCSLVPLVFCFFVFQHSFTSKAGSSPPFARSNAVNPNQKGIIKNKHTFPFSFLCCDVYPSPPPCPSPSLPPPLSPPLLLLHDNFFCPVEPSQGNPGKRSVPMGFPYRGRNKAGWCVLGLGLSSPGFASLPLWLPRTEYPICTVGERPGTRRTGEALLAQDFLWPLPPGQGARGAQLPRVHQKKKKKKTIRRHCFLRKLRP